MHYVSDSDKVLFYYVSQKMYLHPFIFLTVGEIFFNYLSFVEYPFIVVVLHNQVLVNCG